MPQTMPSPAPIKHWLWRAGLTLAGITSYIGVVYLAVGLISPRIAGLGPERIRTARLLANTSYLTGAVVSILIGLLNPHGLIIVAISAAASRYDNEPGEFVS